MAEKKDTEFGFNYNPKNRATGGKKFSKEEIDQIDEKPPYSTQKRK